MTFSCKLRNSWILQTCWPQAIPCWSDAFEDDDFPAFSFGGRWSPSLEGIQVEAKSCDLTTQFGNEKRAPGCLLDIFGDEM